MKKVFLTALVAAFAVAMVSTDALAKAKGASAKKAGSAVRGTLAVVKDATGKATGATITTKSGTVYTLTGLTQDVTALDGKEVHAKGEVKDEAGAMSLTVNGRVRAAGEKKAKKAGAAKQ